jgi:PHP family Zn ribbon phosphoesterase
VKFIADFHIHSKFSRATSPDLDPENLFIFSMIKGISLLGTGDILHPRWREEVSKKLVYAVEEKRKYIFESEMKTT